MSGHPGHEPITVDLPLWAIQEIEWWREIGRELVEMGDCGCVSSAELAECNEVGDDQVCASCRARELLERHAHLTPNGHGGEP